MGMNMLESVNGRFAKGWLDVLVWALGRHAEYELTGKVQIPSVSLQPRPPDDWQSHYVSLYKRKSDRVSLIRSWVTIAYPFLINKHHQLLPQHVRWSGVPNHVMKPCNWQARQIKAAFEKVAGPASVIPYMNPPDRIKEEAIARAKLAIAKHNPNRVNHFYKFGSNFVGD